MNLLLLFALATQANDVQVAIETFDGTTLCSIQAEQASPQAIFSALMREARPLPGVGSLTVVGADRIPAEPLLDFALTERPFGEVLSVIMGCVGLRVERRAKTLVIHPESTPEATNTALLERARRNLFSALTKHPNTSASPRILFSLSRVEEKLGAPDAAQGHLRQLAEEYPQSDLVPKALAQAGAILPKVNNFNRFNGNEITVDTKKGRLLIFPAWLHHAVPVNRSNRKRKARITASKTGQSGRQCPPRASRGSRRFDRSRKARRSCA